MQRPKWVRPSNLPLLVKCPAAGASGAGWVNASSDATELGVAAHEILELYMADEPWLDRVEEIARKHAVDPETLASFFVNADLSFPGAKTATEQPVSLRLDGVPCELEGTADLVCDYTERRIVEVVDLKTGDPMYADPLQILQVEAYACAAAQARGYTEAVATLWYARAGDDGWWSSQIPDVDKTAAEIAGIVREALAQIDLEPVERNYRTGDHCTFCPARGGCPAHLSSLAAVLSLAEIGDLSLTPENVVPLHQRIGQIERLCRSAKDAIKAFVRDNGPVQTADGKLLKIIEVKRSAYTVEASVQEQLRVVKG